MNPNSDFQSCIHTYVHIFYICTMKEDNFLKLFGKHDLKKLEMDERSMMQSMDFVDTSNEKKFCWH